MVPVVTDNARLGRYEIAVDGEVAGYSEYGDHGSVRTFRHTEVAPAFHGRGLGDQLVQGALEDARARGLHVVPVCPFVRHYLAGHTEELDLVEPRHRRAFDLPDPA